MVTPGARREAAAYLRAQHEVSERRAQRAGYWRWGSCARGAVSFAAAG